MSSRGSAVRALTAIIGALVAVGGIAVAAYMLHGAARREHLIDRNYRALAMASDQLRERVDGWRQAIGTEARSRMNVPAAPSQSPRLSGARPSTPTSPSPAPALSCEEASEPEPGTTSTSACPKPLPDTQWITCVQSSNVDTSGAAEHGTRMAIELADDQRSIDAYVAYDHGCDALAPVSPTPLTVNARSERKAEDTRDSPALAAGATNARSRPNAEREDSESDQCRQAARVGEGHCTACSRCETINERGISCSRFPIDEIVAGILPDQALFDGVIVTVGDEPVVLRGVIRGATDVGALLNDDATATRPLQAAKTGEDEAAIGRVGPSERAPEVVIQGERYLKFSHPVAVSSFVTSAAHGERGLRLHGLIRTATFARETHRIGDRWVLTLLLLLVLATLTWPLLKLWYMGAAERLGGLDVRVLALSMVVMAGVITLATMELSWHQALEQSFDAQLGELATSIGGAVAHDIRKALDVLDTAEKGGSSALTFRDFRFVVAVGGDAKPVQACKPKRRDGAWKLVNEARTPALTVSNRQYYRDIRANRFWKLDNEQFAAETVRSKITGDLTMVVARPPRQRSARGIVAEGELRSSDVSPPMLLLIAINATGLLNATVPHGFGFAIVDRTGAVQLHSDSRRALVENFLDQCDRDPMLAAALDVGKPTGPLSIDYAGDQHRAVVRTIRGSPWRLVVFRDRTVLDKVGDEIIALWSALYLGYVAVILVVMLLVQIFDDRYRAEWAWPDRRFQGLFAPTIPRLLATAAVVSVAMDAQEGWARLLFPLAASAGTIGALALALHNPRAAQGAGVLTPVERHGARSIAMSALLTLLLLASAAADWATALAIVALAALWRPVPTAERAPLMSPSQTIALLALATYAVLAWRGAPAFDRALPILVTMVFWFPWDVVARITDPTRASASLSVPFLLGGWADRPPRHELEFRFQYAAMLSALLLVVAVVPALAFYRDARTFVWTELVRFGDARLRADAAAQASRIREEHLARASRVDADDELQDILATVTRAVYRTDWMRWHENAVPGLARAHIRSAQDPGGTNTPAGRDGTSRLLSWHAVPWLPVFADPIPEMRSRATAARDREAENATLQAEKRPKVPHSTKWLVVAALLAIAAGLTLFFIVWSVARLVFLLDVDRDGTTSTVPRGTLNAWQFTAGGGPARLIATASKTDGIVDLRPPITVDALAAKALEIERDDRVTFVEVDHLANVFDDIDLHRALLGFLETLMRGRPKTIVLTSDVDPLHWASARELEAAADATATDASEEERTAHREAQRVASDLLGRWSRVLSEFKRESWQVPAGTHAPQAAKDNAAILSAKYPSLTGEEARSPDDPRFWTIWRQCTRAEKLALRQLAEEGLLNPKSASTVRRLMERLLVFRDPAWSLMSPAFSTFVLRAATSEMVSDWERKGASSWAQLRLPLASIAAIVAVYLVLTERDTLNFMIAATTAAAAALPALMRLFSAIGKQRTGSQGH